MSVTTMLALSEWRLPVSGGHLAGIESPSPGPDVLFVHSHGFSSMTWARVIENLPDLHCVALDVRGHGQSESPLLDAQEGWRDIPRVIRGLGLKRPVLVGHDTGAFAAMCAAAAEPGLVSGVLSIDADMPFKPRVQTQADLDWAQTPEVNDLVKTRFFFGDIITTPEEREQLVQRLTEQCIGDWLLEGVDAAIEREVRRSFVPRPDGTWLHVPSVEAAVIGYRIDIDAEFYPEAALYERVVDPLYMVRYLRSSNAQPLGPYLDLADRLPNMSVYEIDGGHLAHYSHASEVAAIVREAAYRDDPAMHESAMLRRD